MSDPGGGRPSRTERSEEVQKRWRTQGIIASVAVVDEEKGVVLLWMNFGDTNSYGPGNALITFEAFKVFGKDKHEIHAVNAFFRTMPKETKRGWDSTDPVPVAAPWAAH